ncbi:S1C family serine protease [Leptospira kmetyi]|uniref:Serine protease n=1 Tax=Leptospira kmetyi TaxID=408139 RepID=A0ABX4NCN0_9LEPT|nr:trypsin-like peptidase domain-containing protein [Leptospira kmetyi]EQA53716.1 peptidase Do [Leptospira kmetyi serovar Malaysia str. Bejo-Iso9]PJZ31117.1 serine protease [Leptospira kmetyi]PJZ43508.1 serine protease [Leptospira kmetyi]TGK21805.1 PDZ domain-containing protein [Leptospira kmetyi]TGK26775.1 PDZ domain-containing protein [Leptospira kmetyi]
MKNMEKLKYVAVVSVSLLLGAFLSPVMFCGTGQNSPLFLSAKGDKEPSAATRQAITIQQAFEEVYQTASPSVVSIATERTQNVPVHPFGDPFFDQFFGRGQGQGGRVMKQKQTGLGSGIILNTQGYILTNEHVVRSMDKLTVRLKTGKTYNAELIGSDAVIDLALLKIKPDTELVAIELGDSSAVKVGDWAIAIGAPLGYEQSLTAGIVSAVGRTGIDNSGVHYLQTDASINQGNSGGPLLDINGRVIGINRMIASQSGGSVGIGFAIPINEAKAIMEELKTTGKVKRPAQPWLGVGVDYLHEEDAKQLKIPGGAVVVQIMNDSPADRAGIQLMDVITEISGTKINSPEEVVSLVKKSKVGDRITVTILRQGNVSRLSIQLKERPN